MKQFIAKGKKIIFSDIGLLLLPIAGAAVSFTTAVTSISFEIEKIFDINVWINSFMITFIIYGLFNIILLRINFFKKHNLLLAAISFAFSTCLGQSLKWEIYANITWINWIMASISGIVCLVFSYIFEIIGYNIGEDKYEREAAKIKAFENEIIDKMSGDEFESLMSSLKKALSLDDNTFSIIVTLENKKSIQDAISQLSKK